VQLIIFHSHFRPGGVRRVIELATPHLIKHWPERIRRVVLATGEAPEGSWLRLFRKKLQGIPVSLLVQPVLGYASEQAPGDKNLRRDASNAIMALVREALRDQSLIWAHNLGLGRNLYVARELTFTCHACNIPLIAHHHDWWFENRWHHFAAMREPGFCKLDAVANAILPASSCIAHAAINSADAAVLEKHFDGLAGWLPNPVELEEPPSPERVAEARSWLRQRLGNEAPVWLLPSRLLRRKNIAEALLLTRWLRPEAWLATTGGVSSPEEQIYADTLAQAAQSQGWPLRLGILQGDQNAKSTMPELLAASEAVVFTSLQEGFGLPYLEATAAHRPLVARMLPNMAPDLKAFGFSFSQSYKEIRVDPALFNWHAEHDRQARLFAEWKGLMPDSAACLVGKPAVLAAGKQPRPVPFSRLTLTAQLEVLSQPVASSWEKSVALNPFLNRWRRLAGAGRLASDPWPRKATRILGGDAYARRFLELVPTYSSKRPEARAGKDAQAEFLRKKLRAENLYPLLWNSRT
jgi:glycosyltransferase involved in cell wall biosynthesis